MVSPWDNGTRLFEAALDVRSSVHEVIASNMANEETPGFKAQYLPFKETLAATLKGEFPLAPARSHPDHLPLIFHQDRIFQHTKEMNSGSGPDGNTVSLEKEMTGMSQNTMLYMAVSQLLAGRFDGWRAAINEGRGG